MEKEIKTSKMSMTKKLTISGIVIALYVVIMLLTQSFAFGQYQVRIATALYSLSAIHPFLILPLGISNMVSNMLMGGLGFFDTVGGLSVGLLTASIIYLIKKFRINEWLIALPIIFIPGLIVPIWLSYLLNLPYGALALSICIGQILPGLVGVILVKQLRGRI